VRLAGATNIRRKGTARCLKLESLSASTSVVTFNGVFYMDKRTNDLQKRSVLKVLDVQRPTPRNAEFHFNCLLVCAFLAPTPAGCRLKGKTKNDRAQFGRVVRRGAEVRPPAAQADGRTDAPAAAAEQRARFYQCSSERTTAAAAAEALSQAI
jgi:hypothetical protein